MPTLQEGRLQLSFPAGWQAIKFDDQAWYRQDMGSHVKAVDITAFGPAGHWWIEIKDCAGAEPANRPRLSPAEPAEVGRTKAWIAHNGWQPVVQARRRKPFLVDEIAAKVEGTLTALVAAARAPAANVNAATVQPFLAAVAPGAVWHVVLLLGWSEPDFGRLARLLKTKLEQRLHAFNIQCFVVNETVTAPAQPWTVGRISP